MNDPRRYNNISIFSDLESQCQNPKDAPILLIDQSFPPVAMYTDRIRALRTFGYHFAIRNLPVRCYEDYEPILSQMDYILIDCPPSLELLTLNALCAADSVLIPVQCEYFALEGLSDLMATLRAIKRRLNPSIRIFGVLLTMYDGRTNFSNQVAQEVRRHFPGKVFASVIPRNVRLAEAPSHGLPATVYDRSSRGAAAYLAVAEEIRRNEGKL